MKRLSYRMVWPNLRLSFVGEKVFPPLLAVVLSGLDFSDFRLP